MNRPMKNIIRVSICLFILGSYSISVLAQQVKKTTSTTKQKAPVKKTVVKKTTVTKTKVQPRTRDINTADLKMTSREKQMVDEINLVRSNPAGYVKYVTEYVQRSDLTKKTKTVVKELVEELKRTSPLNTLKINPAMYLDAKKFGKELLQTNTIAHSSLPYAENLVFGIENIRDAVIDLLIDDEIENRGHRKNILRKNISLVAVHQVPGTVEDFENCFIQEFR